MNKSVLSVVGIEKYYKQDSVRQQVLNGISIEFNQGESYALTGVSGSGKSTFLHILGGIDTPTAGEVFFDGQNINKYSNRKKESFLNQHVGFVFQFHYLINELTVIENLLLIGQIGGISAEKSKKRALELLIYIGLEDLSSKYPFELSGGELQRISVLRALFNKPKFILADEPTGNLDQQNVERIMDLFLQSQKEWGLGLIICSHDRDVYKKMETVLKLQNGLLDLAKV